MKLLTFFQNHRVAIGALRDGAIVDLASVAPDMITLIAMGPFGLSRAKALVDEAKETIPLADVKLMAPIRTPKRNIMCLGRNYLEHARESYEARGEKVIVPDYPVIFTKATTTINGPYDDIPYDAAVSESIDFEVELGVIVGPGGKNISLENAMNHVFGYVVLNDVTARDMQDQHKQFFKGKSLDGSCPIGPWIVTADEIPDPHNLRLTCRVNDELMQDSNTGEMLFNIPAIIQTLSRGMTLMPGDIVATGTPAGVGFARTPPVYLRPGDVVECEVEGIGSIRNKIAG